MDIEDTVKNNKTILTDPRLNDSVNDKKSAEKTGVNYYDENATSLDYLKTVT